MSVPEKLSDCNGEGRYGPSFSRKMSKSRQDFLSANPEYRSAASQTAARVYRERPFLRDIARGNTLKAWENDEYRKAISSSASTRMQKFCHDSNYQEEWAKRHAKMIASTKKRAQIRPLCEPLLQQGMSPQEIQERYPDRLTLRQVWTVKAALAKEAKLKELKAQGLLQKAMEKASEIVKYYGKESLEEVYKKFQRELPQDPKDLQFLRLFYASRVSLLDAPLKKPREDGKKHPVFEMKDLVALYDDIDPTVFERLPEHITFIREKTKAPSREKAVFDTGVIARGLRRITPFNSFAGVSAESA